MYRRSFLVVLLALGCAETEEAPSGLPDRLPFEVTRDPVGTALTAAEVETFTKRLTAFWKQTDYFDWVVATSHGTDASTGKPEWAIWWHDVEAVKAGDTVTFRHNDRGGAHNVYIPTPKVLAAAASGYLMTGDPKMGRVTELYAKGITASMKGMVYDDADPNEFLMARNIVTQNHAFELADGRKKAVDYEAWYNTYERWNAQRIHFPNNPYWGDVWVTNMRSKDDVPHIFLVAPYLAYVAEQGADAPVREAAAEALEYLRGFAKDIVDHGYHIRTKDADGAVWVPEEDLASFVDYEWIVENGECTAKISAAYIAYDDARGNDCERAEGNEYEAIATGTHYYNYAIVRTFHLSAILEALLHRDDEKARRMIRGLAMRVDRYQDPGADEPGAEEDRWEGELAVYLLRSAAVGLPLTAEETRKIHASYGAALDAFETFDRWNLWDASVPDGTYDSREGFRPPKTGHNVAIEEIALVLEYCFSPFRNPAGAPLVDCDIVADPARW